MERYFDTYQLHGTPLGNNIIFYLSIRIICVWNYQRLEGIKNLLDFFVSASWTFLALNFDRPLEATVNFCPGESRLVRQKTSKIVFTANSHKASFHQPNKTITGTNSNTNWAAVYPGGFPEIPDLPKLNTSRKKSGGANIFLFGAIVGATSKHKQHILQHKPSSVKFSLYLLLFCSHVHIN